MKAKREDLVQSISKVRDASGADPNLSNIDDYLVVMRLNRECRECQRSVYKFGKCTGRTGSIPCLIFAPEVKARGGKGGCI